MSEKEEWNAENSEYLSRMHELGARLAEELKRGVAEAQGRRRDLMLDVSAVKVLVSPPNCAFG